MAVVSAQWKTALARSARPCTCIGAAVGLSGTAVGAASAAVCVARAVVFTGKPAAVVTVPRAKPCVVHTF